ncbi:MAG TPA: phosphoribosyltransferase [Rhizobiaceae bacterium]|nr:phosphoribosyltransferase [Rhizobiaceae bacterium]
MQAHDFWQEIYPPGTFSQGGPYSDAFPASLPDGSQILLPIRPMPDGEHALASLIINQASFAVQDAIADALADRLVPFEPEIVVGLPTLGLTLAAAVARKLGHGRYVPFGTSRKFWYDEELSLPLSSITSPSQSKRLYVDPRMLPLLRDARIALVDDVSSSGVSLAAGLDLMALCGLEPKVLGVAMLQTDRWKARLSETDPSWPDRIESVFHTPMLTRAGDGEWKDSLAI